MSKGERGENDDEEEAEVFGEGHTIVVSLRNVSSGIWGPGD